MSTENTFRFLRSATGRLAMTYLAIIMLMSIGFSTVLYNTSSSQLGRQIPNQALVGGSFSPNGFGSDVQSFLQQRIDEGRQALLVRLIWLNVLALVAGATVSYYLARRTLRPIEESMEAQTQFVSDASHELRTPLTAIRASNEVAMRKAKLSLQDANQVIKQNAEDVIKLQELTDGLLRLANNSDLAKHKLTPIPLQEAAAEAMNQVVQLAQAKDITVNDEVANIKVLGNKQSLVQVITILLDNAIKYSEAKATVTVDSAVKGRFVHLNIRDNGIGIRSADLPHIFKRFYRVDRSRSKDQRDGYGLGLSIAAKLVEQTHGEILVTSTPGQGSIFTIKLPTT
jgi:two-component system sensor histidine kinase CiaH